MRVEIRLGERRGAFAGRRDEQHDLAAWRVLVGERLGKFVETPAPHRLVHLRQFAGDRRRARAEHGGAVGQRLGEAARALEEDQRAGHSGQFGEARTARPALLRQKALEEEAVGRQAGHHQRRQNGRRPGHGGDVHAPLQRLLHELEARIGHERRAGVGHQRQPVARLQPREKMRANHLGVVLVIGDQGCGYPVMGEQRLGDARILRDHRIGGGERRKGAEGNILEIADRRRHNV